MPKQQILQMNQIDYRFFEKARQVAMISDYHKTHVGCVAVYHGNIIGIGCNCNKTHPTQDHYNKYRKKSSFRIPRSFIAAIQEGHGLDKPKG